MVIFIIWPEALYYFNMNVGVHTQLIQLLGNLSIKDAIQRLNPHE